MAKHVQGSKVRYAVVGAGWISQAAFMPGVAHTGNSEMTAIVTGDEEKAQALGKRYGITNTYHYDAYAKALDSGQFDAIYLALPNWQHREFAVPALERGIHVLLEKPMATSEEDCLAIQAAAEKTGAKLLVAYRLHFEPATLEAIRMVRAGELGKARLFTSAFSQHVSKANHRAKHGFWAGPVADMGPYPINACRNLFGAEPIEVTAMGLRHPEFGFDFDDTVSVTLRFPGNRLAQFTVAYGLNGHNHYRVQGTDGDLLVQPGFAFPGPLKHTLTMGKRTTERSFPAVDQFGGETQYFSDCVLHDRPVEPDGEEGLMDVRVVAAIGRALETGRPQTLPPAVRDKYPTAAQATTLPAIKPPPFVNAHEPSEG